MAMKNLSIFGKIFSIALVFGIFVIAVAFYATGQVKFINSEYTHLKNGLTFSTENIAQANADIQGMEAHTAQVMLDAPGSADQKADLSATAWYKDRFGQFLDQSAIASPSFANDFMNLKSHALQVVDGACGNSVHLATSATTAAEIATAQATYLNECAPQFPALVKGMQGLKSRLLNSEAAKASTLTKVTNVTVMTTFMLILGGLVLMMLGGFFAVRSWIVMPIKGLQNVMGRLSGGDLQARITGADRKDEIGGMARAVQVFKDAGIEKQRLETKPKVSARPVERSAQRIEAERAEAAKQQRIRGAIGGARVWRSCLRRRSDVPPDRARWSAIMRSCAAISMRRWRNCR